MSSGLDRRAECSLRKEVALSAMRNERRAYFNNVIFLDCTPSAVVKRTK